MDMWTFISFWDYVRYTARNKGVEVSFNGAGCPEAIEFRVKNPVNKKATSFWISRFDLENLADATRLLTEKLLDMINEVKE